MERYGTSGVESTSQESELERALVAALRTKRLVISPEELARHSITDILREKMGLRFLPERRDLSS